MRLGLILVLGLWLCVAPAGAFGQDVSPEAGAESPYLGAAGCKDCHQAIYDAWQKTKHARALDRLSGSEREGGQCIGCHVTGTAEQIALERGSPSLPNVQCEACHGPARSHAAAAASTAPSVRAGVIRRPEATQCEGCHSPRSPKFKGFFYAGMVAFVHRVQ